MRKKDKGYSFVTFLLSKSSVGDIIFFGNAERNKKVSIPTLLPK